MVPTILIIEDDPVTTDLVRHQLKCAGYRVLSASDGFQGLKMLQASSPDVLVLDLMLPDVDGLEVLDQLRSDPHTAHTPVIVLTARTDPTDQHTAKQIGANAYLTKPYSRTELLTLIASLVSGKPKKRVSAAPA